jgi:hypothetical protein
MYWPLLPLRLLLLSSPSLSSLVSSLRSSSIKIASARLLFLVTRHAPPRPAPSQPDGSFAGDRWGEIDTRFSYCVLNCLALLKRSHLVDTPKAVDFIVRCQVRREKYRVHKA